MPEFVSPSKEGKGIYQSSSIDKSSVETLEVERKKVQEILRSLLEDNPDVLGSALISNDGLVMASSLSESIDQDILSAIFTALESIAQRACRQMKFGAMDKLVLLAEKGGAIICPFKKEYLLVLIRGEAKLGIILMDVDQAIERLKKSISMSSSKDSDKSKSS